MTIIRRGETRTAMTAQSGPVRRHDLSRHWRNSRTLGYPHPLSHSYPLGHPHALGFPRTLSHRRALDRPRPLGFPRALGHPRTLDRPRAVCAMVGPAGNITAPEITCTVMCPRPTMDKNDDDGIHSC